MADVIASITEFGPGAGILQSIVTESGTSRTLSLLDVQKMIRCTSSSAVTITVPQNVTTAFPIGAVIEVWQDGAGGVTLAGAGVTLLGTLQTATQGQMLRLIKTGTDEWVATPLGHSDGGGLLNPTSVKTADYTAVVSDLVRVDISSGNVEITLPASPSTSASVGVSVVKNTGSSHQCTLNLNGAMINGGSVSGQFILINEGDNYVLRYDGSDAGWVAESLIYAAADDPGGYTFSEGTHTFEIPRRATSMTVHAWGAGGQSNQYGAGASHGGAGGYTTATFPLDPTDIVKPGIRLLGIVGGCGTFGKPGLDSGGADKAILGGGYTGLFLDDTESQAKSVVIAGGGGGSGGDYHSTPPNNGYGGNSSNSGGSSETDPMRGEDYPNATYVGGSGGGGYVGGSEDSPHQPGNGGTGFVHADASSSSIEGVESGHTPPQTGHAEYGGSAGEGANNNSDLGKPGRLVVLFSYT